MVAETYVRIHRVEPYCSEAVLVATRMVNELAANGRVTVEEMEAERILLRIAASSGARPVGRDDVARLLTEARFDGWELADIGPA